MPTRYYQNYIHAFMMNDAHAKQPFMVSMLDERVTCPHCRSKKGLPQLSKEANVNMDINIQNCNNIDCANISISKGKLNIKFAPNGTGKSTIAKAILNTANNNSDAMTGLLPFKYHNNNPEAKTPLVSGLDSINLVMCFNEEYVSQFTFKPDELISNSFDIFIRTDAYKATEQQIGDLVQEIRQQFTNNSELDALISNLEKLSSAFKTTSRGKLSKSSTGMKSLASGNKIEHIPDGLVGYKPFIQSNKSVSWIDWQSKGHQDFSELSDCCPFCAAEIKGREANIEKVGKEYDKGLIKNLMGIIEIITNLGDYFSTPARERLNEITSLKDGLEDEHENFIIEIKAQTDILSNKLKNLKELSSFHFKEGGSVSDTLTSYRFDLKFFEHLDSEKTQESIAGINSSIEVLIKRAGYLTGKINIQRNEIKKLIEKYQSDIDRFLSSAGYRYSVEIVGEGEKAQLKLRHIDHDKHISGGNQHLSYGERNAFSIVLFMYECLSKRPDLIILDDPISSFDKNKKFAILKMLFRGDAASSLKGKTVLMLTHDVEPIIDTVRSVKKQFSNQVSASFLKLKGAEIIEQQILNNDIKTFTQICQGMLISDHDDIVKLIYLRRYYEILDDKGDVYEVISNLLHKREKPIDSRVQSHSEEPSADMDQATFLNGVEAIKQDISGFDYSTLLARLLDTDSLKELYISCQNGYEKLQIFRVLEAGDLNNSVIQKFSNETYHIENEFICQLDPSQFDLIPEYVIKECDKILGF